MARRRSVDDDVNAAYRRARLELEMNGCPDCGGRGYFIVAECCGHLSSSGDCCGNPEPAQEQCRHPIHDGGL
jgi:hypothetical protein